jgi:hypothetical protein
VPRADSGWYLVVPLTIAGSGLGLLVSQLNNDTLAPVSEERVGEAAGVNSAAGSSGLSFGLAFAGAIMLATLSLAFTQMGQSEHPPPPGGEASGGGRAGGRRGGDEQHPAPPAARGSARGHPGRDHHITAGARPLALQIALLIPILAGLIGLFNAFRMVRMPEPVPVSAVEGMDFG